VCREFFVKAHQDVPCLFILYFKHCFISSKNYTYPIVARARRSLMQALEQGIQVSIHPPGIEWEKVIGTKDIGASFGLVIRNVLDFQLGKLL